ncbi:MAG: phenylalanine--tRNA ligase subunit beta [Gemmatimonadetes bacterium]|nr:phenylalanine--tRNA ligase subunit beta [Gemmatimonadota bacterium]
MNISHEWLKAFVPHALDAAAVRELLTAHVATVEGFEAVGAELESFVVARVVESEKIPDTRLSFNKVDDGSGELIEVVCGAPNVTVGAKYPFARSGTTMPGGLLIEKRKIRGFVSNGMLCSPSELGLGDDHDGILELTTDAATGTRLLDVLDLSDARLVVDVLPNRPDLLSHQGFAYELTALTGVAKQMPPELADLPATPKPAEGESEAAGRGVSVRLESTADCPHYCAIVIRGVTVGPSPDWLKRRIESVGARSINNVVDATNYILHGFGQPVHAFDLAKIGGSSIVVRRARSGETLTTLDGTARVLSNDVLVIADAERPTALAGIMGGQASEVTEGTTDILLEVATFSPKQVRAGRRHLGIATDASYRFERGINDKSVPRVAPIAAGLIAMVAGGTIEEAVNVGVEPPAHDPISLRPERVSRLLGDEVSADETARLLTSIGFAVHKSGDAFQVTAPSWRHDVTLDVDLIEEVARLRGYDRLPDVITGSRPSSVPDHPMHVVGRRVRDALVAHGLFEVRPLPFTASTDAAAALVRVRNPLGDDEPFLRDSILTTLAGRAEYNLSRMQGDVRMFEIGTAFVAEANGALSEEIRVGALVMGARRPRHFTEPDPPAFDAWDAKELAELVVRTAWPGARAELSAELSAEARAGETGALWSLSVEGTVRGHVREITLDAPVWAAPAFGVELTLGKMPAAAVAARGAHDYSRASDAAPRPQPVRYARLAVTPAAVFDLALIVPDAVSAAQVEQTIRGSAGELLEAVLLFDEFRGDGIPAGTRSLAWRLTFRHPDRTLRDKEIDGRRSQLLKTLDKEIGVRARTA